VSKGLGKLQKCILKEIHGDHGKRTLPATNDALQQDIQGTYWGDIVWEKGPELSRRRASISRSLRSLKSRGLIGFLYGVWYLDDITEEGKPSVYEVLKRIENNC